MGKVIPKPDARRNETSQGEIRPFDLDKEGLEKLERQLIPLLNTIRRLLGKPPLIAPDK